MKYCNVLGKNCNEFEGFDNNHNTGSKIEAKTDTKTDPNIDNGMMTKVWGPPGWLFLHCITFGYPFKIDNNNPEHREKRDHFINFFHYLGRVLPCKYCRNSYIEYMKELPVEKNLESREKLTKWLYDMHNKINDKLGVPACDIPDFKEVQKYYESFRAKCAKTTEEERENNKAKGCVTPADGTPRRSLLTVVKCTQGDVTRRENAKRNKEEYKEEYIYIKRTSIYIALSVVIILLLTVWNKENLYNIIKNMIKMIKNYKIY